MDSKWIVNLSGKEHVLYGGLLAEAHERGIEAIETQLVQIPAEENGHTAIARAVVRMKDGSSFAEYGDANPRNVNARIATALIRMALTRAKGRALRDAVNVGVAMFEELPGDEEHAAQPGQARAREAVAKGERPLVTKAGEGGDAPAACVECGVVLTPGQVKVSQAKWKLNLCPTHQAAAAKATNGKAAEVAA